MENVFGTFLRISKIFRTPPPLLSACLGLNKEKLILGEIYSFNSPEFCSIQGIRSPFTGTAPGPTSTST